MMMTWRTTDEQEWEASVVECGRQTADRLGRHGAQRRSLRPLPSRGAQPGPVLRLEEAALELGHPRLPGPAGPAQRARATPRGGEPAAQERDRRDHRREPRPKKGALGLEDHGPLQAERQQRVHEEVEQTKHRSGWPVKQTLAALGVAPRSYYRWLKE